MKTNLKLFYTYRKILYSLIFFFILNVSTLISFLEGSGLFMKKTEKDYHKTYLVSRVIDASTIELKNGKTVKLLGVDTKISDVAAKLFLNDLTEGKKVIIETDESSTCEDQLYYVYVWGVDSEALPPHIDVSNFEYHGFLDVKDSISGGTRKGLSVFLNATMIKSGIARVNTKNKFKFEKQFIEFQKVAQQKKIGIWKEGN